MPAKVVLVSERPEDQTFCEAVTEDISKVLPVTMKKVLMPNELESLFMDNPVVMIDSAQGNDVAWARLMGQMLARHVRSERVFVLADEPLTSTSWLADASFYGHFLLRRLEPPAMAITSRLAQISLHPNPTLDHLNQQLNDLGATQSILLDKVKKKGVAVEAIHATLKKRGLPERICANVAQAADELMLNGFFSAPRDAAGKPYRKDLVYDPDYEDFFDLKEKEKVRLEMTSHSNYFTVCVHDFFGTLERRSIQSVMKRDYQKAEYSVRAKTTSAGLGIYDIFRGGLSLLFAVMPNKETQAWLFVPYAENYKKFRSTFQFFSFWNL